MHPKSKSTLTSRGDNLTRHGRTLSHGLASGAVKAGPRMQVHGGVEARDHSCEVHRRLLLLQVWVEPGYISHLQVRRVRKKERNGKNLPPHYGKHR